jgi:acyl-CoA synthetase (AMP-forming)/AMP-acid ligase II
MGLIGTFLTSVLNDLETCLLPPEDFLGDPGRWVRVISRHRATITAAPSTGYLHTLRKVSDEVVRELDLSGWRLALNGAEAIDPDTMRQFSAHFAPAGFRQTSFLPVYGLAEGTLAVSCSPVGRPVRTAWVRRNLLSRGIVAFATQGAELAREVVSVGAPVAGTDVRLVAEDGAELPDGRTVGELQIRGASVMRGYEAGGQTGWDGIHDGGWVSTGDLGFRHDGELYIAGRKKEMVIVLGQNHYASDIESVAGRLPGVSVNGVLAASVRFADGEGLVLIAETRETCPQARSELVAQIRLAVSGGLGVTPREVVLARRGQLPRTSSGKLQRHDTTALYERLRAESAAMDAADLADQPHGRQES